MYDSHDDDGHHHVSQYKQIAAYKRQAPSLAWALLGTLWALFGTLDILHYLWETLLFYDLGLNLLKSQNNLLDKCLIQLIVDCMDVVW